MEITVNRKIEYVDDTPLLANKEDTIFIFHKFNFFNKNLKLTIGYFDDNNIHFHIIQSTKKIYTTNSFILVNILTLKQ